MVSSSWSWSSLCLCVSVVNTLSLPQQAPQQRQADQGDDAVRRPDEQEQVPLAILGHAGAAEHQGVVEKHDWHETGDERTEVVAAAEPDADGATDQDEEEAA